MTADVPIRPCRGCGEPKRIDSYCDNDVCEGSYGRSYKAEFSDSPTPAGNPQSDKEPT